MAVALVRYLGIEIAILLEAEGQLFHVLGREAGIPEYGSLADAPQPVGITRRLSWFCLQIEPDIGKGAKHIGVWAQLKNFGVGFVVRLFAVERNVYVPNPRLLQQPLRLA